MVYKVVLNQTLRGRVLPLTGIFQEKAQLPKSTDIVVHRPGKRSWRGDRVTK